MRARILPAIPLLAALVSGCASDAGLADLYGGAKTDDGVLLIEDLELMAEAPGLEMSASDGVLAVLTELGELATPAMAAPMPLGGGADAAAFEPEPLEVRLTLGNDAPKGYHAYWALHPIGTPPARDQVQVVRASEAATFVLEAPGIYEAHVALDRSKGLDPFGEDRPEGVANRTLKVVWTAHGTFRGEVQPFKPGGILPSAGTTPAEDMRDAYVVPAAANAPVRVVTRFEGTRADGTDIDVGLHGPSGPYVCVGSGGATMLPLVPDPAQALEELVAIVPEGGAWTIVVGAMEEACPTEPGGVAVGWYYNNHGPVPYSGEVWVGSH